MTARLDALVTPRGSAAAALVEVTVKPARGPRGLAAYASKHPVALLVHVAGATHCFEPDGRAIDAEAFEARYPGQLTAFERRVSSLPP